MASMLICEMAAYYRTCGITLIEARERMYKKYGVTISRMGCRANLSPWFERGGMFPADEDDKPIYEGRFNLGAISLHFPMIVAKAKQENKDFRG